MNTGLDLVSLAAVASSAYPLGRGLWCERRTALVHSLGWLAAAWTAWLLAVVAPWLEAPERPLRYLALCLLACSGVAVLGARRPGAWAWNFVTGGLLAVLMLPLLEQSFWAAGWQLDGPRAGFLGCALAVGVLNYVPTRWGIVALAATLGIGDELVTLIRPTGGRLMDGSAVSTLLALCPWCVWWINPAGQPDDAAGRWRAFRDRFGAAWGIRVRDQFNNAARNARRKETLTWFGVEPEKRDNDEAAATLAALLQRFEANA